MEELKKRFQEVIANALRASGALGVAPEKLYHYTSPAGLEGIVSTNTLWFGDAFFLNDASEIQYGVDLVEAALKRWCADRPLWQVNLAKKIHGNTFRNSLSSRPAAFCMSDGPNILNQWRDYGKDRVAYSIGFEPRQLRRCLHTDVEAGSMVLLQMIYEPARQEILLGETINSVMSEVVAHLNDKEPPSEAQDEIADIAALPLTIGVLALKHPDFSAEREWRLCTSVEALIARQKFRGTPLGLAPYYVVGLSEGEDRLPIKDVMVGPSPHGFVAEMGVKLLLKKHGYDDVTTSHSQIPLRY